MKTVLSLILLCCLIACGSSRNPTPNVAGNWQFNGHSSVSDQDITGSTTIQQKGSSVTAGAITVNGTTCTPMASSSGSIIGTTITIQMSLGNQVLDMTGTINSAGNSASGSYTGGCTIGDFGTWSAAKAS
ncbi:MAG: hypothetical protein ABSD53_09275 [Terriglobales bacterium]